MGGWVRIFSSAAAACAVGLTTAVAASPAAVAAAGPQTRLILGGAEYEWAEWFPAIAALPLVTRYVTPNRQIGEGFFPGSVPVLIDYPGSLFRPGTANEHINIAVDRLDAAIKQRQEPLAVVGQSQGTVALDRMRAKLEGDPGAPVADQLQFVLFNSPTRGLATTLFQEGVRIPVVDVIVTPPSESRYDTSVVIHEYDIWGDFPDRPWNLVTLLNALTTMAFVHQLAYEAPGDIAPENITTMVNSLGATDTTYFFPAHRLPLTEVLRVVGVPDEAVDRLDEVLRPIIDAGYSRNDKPGDPRPYLDGGVLTTHQGSARTVAAASASASTSASASAVVPAAPDASTVPEPAAGDVHGRGRVAEPTLETPALERVGPEPPSPETASPETPGRRPTAPTRAERATPGAAATVSTPSETRSTARAPHRDRRR